MQQLWRGGWNWSTGCCKASKITDLVDSGQETEAVMCLCDKGLVILKALKYVCNLWIQWWSGRSDNNNDKIPVMNYLQCGRCLLCLVILSIISNHCKILVSFPQIYREGEGTLRKFTLGHITVNLEQSDWLHQMSPLSAVARDPPQETFLEIKN